ncbi:MAG: hypothetical protein IK099_03765 [Clostridia bacterium]|nr:hypothetical protein [Clostridia bacterium]
MKKIITLVLAVAMLMTSVVALAETHATPNISTFATMKTKTNEGAHTITITLSKPVDRLLVNWAEKGAEPEELAVDENLKAVALTWGHKYMPGTTQYYATAWADEIQELTEGVIGYEPDTSEAIYALDGNVVVIKEVKFGTTVSNPGVPTKRVYINGPERVFTGEAAEKFVNADGTLKTTEWNAAIKAYMDQYGFTAKEMITVEPYYDTEGNLVASIQGLDSCPDVVRNPNFQTVIANRSQRAFFTVQGEWAVYYNRYGQIVGIEYFEGQF